MPFYHAGQRSVKTLIEGVQARTFWGENIMLAYVDLAANAVIPKHNHPHEQAGIVLMGELEFSIQGKTQSLHPGDMYIIPGGADHAVTVGDQPARVLDIFSPVREEYKY